MSSNLIKQPYEMILDPTGGGGRAKPVANGKFYVGEIDKDPIANPRTDIVYRDESGQERPLASPLTLNNSGAFVVSKNDGTIILPYMKDGIGFSVLIQDARGRDVYSDLNTGDPGNIAEAISEYTAIAYKASGGKSAVENMLAGIPIAAKVGDRCTTGGTAWERIASNNDASDFKAIGSVCAFDFGIRGVGDETDKIQKFLSSSGCIKDFGCDLNLTATGNLVAPKNTKIIGRNVNIHTTGRLECVGAISSSLGSLTSAASKGDRDLKVSFSSGLGVGDYVIIHNQDLGSFSRHRDYYTDGEWCVVSSFSGGVIKVDSRLMSSYPTSGSVKIFKVDDSSFSIKGVNVVSASTSSALKISLCQNVTIGCVTENDSGNSSLDIDRCFGVFLKGGEHSCRAPSASQQYGCSLRGVQNFNSVGTKYFGSRHGFTTGGTLGDGYVPNRNVWVEGGETSSETSHSSDFHGNIENSGFIDVNHRNGVVIAGKNTSARGGEALGCDGQALGFREPVGGTLKFSDMKIGSLVGSRAPIDQQSTSESIRIDEDIEFIAEGIEVEIPSSGFNSRIARLSISADSDIRYSYIFRKFKLNGDSNLTGFFLTSGGDRGGIGNFVIEDVDLGRNNITKWTDNVSNQCIEGETLITLPTTTYNTECTIPNGKQKSDESSIAPSPHSEEFRFDVTPRTVGFTTGAYWIVPVTVRSHIKDDIRVGITTPLKPTSEEVKTNVTVQVGINNRLYKAGY